MSISLLTAVEVAQILKLNHQVVLRKLASGQIEAYKIGKEWRVREEALVHWLEAHSNRTCDERSKVLRSFFNAKGRLTSIPTKQSRRIVVLERLLSEFEPQRVYTEREVNAVLRRFHDDVCTLRREFIIHKMMVRKDGRYRVRTAAVTPR